MYILNTQMYRSVKSHIFQKAKQDGKKPRYVSMGDVMDVVAIDKRQFSVHVAIPCAITDPRKQGPVPSRDFHSCRNE